MHDKQGAIVRSRARQYGLATMIVNIHKAHVVSQQRGVVRMERECRLDTGVSYTINREYHPINVESSKEQLRWMLLLDDLGFDMKGVRQ